MEEEHKEPRPDLGPCARCGRQVKNAKFIGSLLVGRDCRRKMLQEGYSEGVHKCPLCHSILPEEHKLSVKEAQVVLEPTIKLLSLIEFDTRSKFVPPPQSATFQLLSVEVVKDEEREGNSDDGKTANRRDDEGGRGDSPEDVSGAGRSEGKTESAEEVHRKRSDSSEPSEDA